MKINLYHLDEQLAAISSCSKALEELYYCTIESTLGDSVSFPYMVLVFAQRIGEAKRALDSELDDLLLIDSDNMNEEVTVMLTRE